MVRVDRDCILTSGNWSQVWAVGCHCLEKERLVITNEGALKAKNTYIYLQ